MNAVNVGKVDPVDLDFSKQIQNTYTEDERVRFAED